MRAGHNGPFVRFSQQKQALRSTALSTCCVIDLLQCITALCIVDPTAITACGRPAL